MLRVEFRGRARHVFDAAGPASRFEIHGHLRNDLENIKEPSLMTQGKQRGNLAEGTKINRKESQYVGKQKYNG